MFGWFHKHNPADRKEIAELKATVKSLQNKLEVFQRNNEALRGQVERLRQAEAHRIGMAASEITDHQHYRQSPPPVREYVPRMDKPLPHRAPSLARSNFYADEERRHERHEYHDRDDVLQTPIVPIINMVISHDPIRQEPCSSHTDREDSSYTEPDTGGSSDCGSSDCGCSDCGCSGGSDD